jgi:hypothetical protein
VYQADVQLSTVLGLEAYHEDKNGTLRILNQWEYDDFVQIPTLNFPSWSMDSDFLPFLPSSPTAVRMQRQKGSSSTRKKKGGGQPQTPVTPKSAEGWPPKVYEGDDESEDQRQRTNPIKIRWLITSQEDFYQPTELVKFFVPIFWFWVPYLVRVFRVMATFNIIVVSVFFDRLGYFWHNICGFVRDWNKSADTDTED